MGVVFFPNLFYDGNDKFYVLSHGLLSCVHSAHRTKVAGFEFLALWIDSLNSDTNLLPA